jgi:hypothetical protein
VIAEASGLAKWKQVATPRMISANVAGHRHDLAMPCPLLAGRRWDACGQRCLSRPEQAFILLCAAGAFLSMKPGDIIICYLHDRRKWPKRSLIS